MEREIRYEEFAVAPADGPRLLGRSWLPPGEPRSTIAIVHGYAEHSGRYDWTGRELAGRGHAVYAADLRGHGRSEGETALVRSFNEYLDDVDAFIAHVRANAPGPRPFFLLGHSMGGTIVALSMVTRRPRVDGIILSGAVLIAGTNVLQRLGASVVMRLGRYFPGVRQGTLDAAKVSRDPEVVAAYVNDPLVYHGGMPWGTAAALVRAVRAIRHRMGATPMPMLVLHGKEDKLAAPQGSADFCLVAMSHDKTLKLYDGLHHEILNEPEREQVLGDVAAWLDGRTLPADEQAAPTQTTTGR